jgi:hypothetical protein
MIYKECACCGGKTLEYIDENHSRVGHDICPVCGWQDDHAQNDEPDLDGGANFISLNEAKKALAEGKDPRVVKAEAKRKKYGRKKAPWEKY